MRSLVAFALVVLSGCSLVEDQGTPIPFRPVSTTVLADSAEARGFGGVVASAEDAQAVRLRTGLDSTDVPELDWTREVLFLQSQRLLPTQRLFMERVRLKRDVLDLELVVRRGDGPVGEPRTVLSAFVLTVGRARLPGGVSIGTRFE